MNNAYDWLKAIGQVILPAVLTFVGVAGTELGWAHIETIMKIGTAFITMYNSIIIIWNKQYYKEQYDALNFNDYSAVDKNEVGRDG